MKYIRIIFLCLVVVSTSILLISLGLQGMEEKVLPIIVDVSLQGMHITFVVSCILSIIYCYKKQIRIYLILFIIPLIFFILSFVLVYFGIRFLPVILFIFDIYILIVCTSFLTLLSINYRKN